MGPGDLVRIFSERHKYVSVGSVALNESGEWIEGDHFPVIAVDSGTLGFIEGEMRLDGKRVFILWVPSQESFGWLWRHELEVLDETRRSL